MYLIEKKHKKLLELQNVLCKTLFSLEGMYHNIDERVFIKNSKYF